MSDDLYCQFLGRPIDGLFYYRDNRNGDIFFVEEEHQVDAFLDGGFANCPPRSVILSGEDIVVGIHGAMGTKVVLDVVVQIIHFEKAGRQRRIALIEGEDLVWLLEDGHVKPGQVKLHKSLEPLRRVLCTLLLSESAIFAKATAYP